jgi:hypothetical protein
MLLFETSPIEDEDGPKKKKGARKKKQEEPPPPAAVERRYEEKATPYILSIESLDCQRCGCPVDLIKVNHANGMWIVQCGWCVSHIWEIEPIPGLLEKDEQDERPDEFVLRDGPYAGMTFDQVLEQEDGEEYIRMVARMPKMRQSVRDAASAWLAWRFPA